MTVASRSSSGSTPARIFRAETDEDPVLQIDRIDLEALAEEVVALLKRELRLERERRGLHHDRRELRG